MTGTDRATVIGRITLASEKLKKAIKSAKEGDSSTAIRGALHDAFDEIDGALQLVGYQMPFDDAEPAGEPDDLHEADADDAGAAAAGADDAEPAETAQLLLAGARA